MGRYNPLLAGDIERAGELNGMPLWRLTYRPDGPHPEMVEAELERTGYRPVRIDGKQYWVSQKAVEALDRCAHELCVTMLAMPQELQPEAAGDGSVDIFVPVVCRLCGKAGVYSLSMDAADVCWDGESAVTT